MEEEIEFCPNCEANLTMQRGYDNSLPYWICTGCGEMLINPEVNAPSDIIWRCDSCGAVLNIQDNFTEDSNHFICTVCGYDNELNDIFESEAERITYESNPLLGLTDDEVLELSQYRDICNINDRDNILLLEHIESGQKYVMKLLSIYDKSIYEYLESNPIINMPGIIAVYEGKNYLIVIEEFIEGKTITQILDRREFSEDETVKIAVDICKILDKLHNISSPIIHRDVKPSNVMIRDNDTICLLDMNASKWYNPEKNDDTRYLGTENFAAPEQVGFGLSSSSTKSDIYALGMLMNVMLTGHFPKEERARGKLWDIIERCISMEADNRYTARELEEVLLNL